MAKLNPKQTLFCQEYLVDLNATQAAIRAGYSVKTAKETGYENLTKPHIAESTGITADYVLQGIKDLTDKLVLGEDHKSAYKGYELLGKHLALFTEKTDHTSSDGSMTPTKITRTVVDAT